MIIPPKENEYTVEQVTRKYFEKMNAEDVLKYFGFRQWDGNLLLIPLTQFKHIPDGTILVSIMGNRVIKGNDPIDDDTRGGMMAVGFTKSQYADVAELFIKLKIKGDVV